MLLVALGSLSCSQEKTAYVDNEKVAEEYYKLKDMRERYDKKQAELSKEIDSLAAPFQKLYDEYMEKRDNMSQKNRQQKEQQLRKMQQQIRAKQNQESRKLQQERGAEADSLVKVMEDKIADYADNKGYTYIFGSNQSSNIIYGDKSKNITDDVIKMLNEGQAESKEDNAEDQQE